MRFARMRAGTVDRVTAYARSRVLPEEAADVVAETYLIAWRRFPQVPSKPLPWLLVVARNTMSEQRRAAARNLALVAEIERLHDLRTPADPDVGAEVTERLAVLAALDSLSPPDRELLMLTVWDGLSTRQTATVLGCSPTAAAVRLHRARTRLTSAMAAQDATDTPRPTPPARETALEAP